MVEFRPSFSATYAEANVGHPLFVGGESPSAAEAGFMGIMMDGLKAVPFSQIRAVVTLGCKGLRNMWVESQRPQALRRCSTGTGYSPMVLPAGTRPSLFGGD